MRSAALSFRHTPGEPPGHNVSRRPTVVWRPLKQAPGIPYDLARCVGIEPYLPPSDATRKAAARFGAGIRVAMSGSAGVDDGNDIRLGMGDHRSLARIRSRLA